MALVLILIAAILAANTNLMMRKNLDYDGTSRAFLLLFFFVSFLMSFVVYPTRFDDFSYKVFCTGSVTGALLYLMMSFLAKAVQTGPSGMSFTFQNAGSVLPAIFLFFLFGPSFQFELPVLLIIGSLLVIAGLYWSASKKSTSGFTTKWLFFAVSAFLLQGLILSVFFWKDFLFDPDLPGHPLVPFKSLIEEEKWFMPGFFIIPTIIQAVSFFFIEKRMLKKKEILFGSIAGMGNGIANFLLLFSTGIASISQKGILFPLFAISVIIFCNLWAKWLYQERANWIAIGLCSLGILIGAIG